MEYPIAADIARLSSYQYLSFIHFLSHRWLKGHGDHCQVAYFGPSLGLQLSRRAAMRKSLKRCPNMT